MVLPFVSFPINLRRSSHDLAKDTAEVIGIVVSNLITDLIDPHRRKIQVVACLLNTHVIEIGDGRRAGLVMKECIEARRRKMKLPCYIFYLYPLFDVFFHIMNRQIDHILFHFLMRWRGLTVQIQIFEGS